MEKAQHHDWQPSPHCDAVESCKTHKPLGSIYGEVNVRPTTSRESLPDGGYGWVCVAAAAVINAHSWGFNSAYAIFLARYLKNDTFSGGSPLIYAFVGSLSVTFLFLTSPIATYAVKRIGIRKTMLCGSILETTSFICASFATELWQLFMTQGILFGMGLGLLFVPTAAVVPQWFSRRRSLASGISLSGAAAGGAVYSLVAEAMIERLGLKWTFRVLGIIGFVVNNTCVLLIKDRSKVRGPNQTTFNVSHFRRKEYCLLLGFGGFTMLGYFVLIFTLANYANEIGLNHSQASLVSALFNVGQAIGRPLAGYISDKTGRMNVAGSLTCAAGVLSVSVWVVAKNQGVLIFFVLCEGLVAGNFWATIGPLMAEVLGIRNVPSGLSLMWLGLSLPSTFGEPIALEIFIKTGDYLGAQLFTGFSYIGAAICILLLRGWKLEQRSLLTSTVDSNYQTQETVEAGSELLDVVSKDVRFRFMFRRCLQIANV